MYSHCKVEQEIFRWSHGPGVVVLQRKPQPLPQGGRRDEPEGNLQASLSFWFHVYLLTHDN